jgi:hypothetical protein
MFEKRQSRNNIFFCFLNYVHGTPDPNILAFSAHLIHALLFLALITPDLSTLASRTAILSMHCYSWHICSRHSWSKRTCFQCTSHPYIDIPCTDVPGTLFKAHLFPMHILFLHCYSLHVCSGTLFQAHLFPMHILSLHCYSLHICSRHSWSKHSCFQCTSYPCTVVPGTYVPRALFCIPCTSHPYIVIPCTDVPGTLFKAHLLPMHSLFLHCYSWFLALLFTALLIQTHLLAPVHILSLHCYSWAYVDGTPDPSTLASREYIILALLFLVGMFTAFLIQTHIAIALFCMSDPV